MQTEVRAGIAYIAGRLILDTQAAFVYDHFSATKHLFTGDVAAGRVHVYDIARNCYFGGLFNGVQFCLWHYRNRHQVDLKIEGNTFKGYDHSKNRSFHGSVTPDGIRICDFETGGYSLYSI